jgi:hypothetical protein
VITYVFVQLLVSVCCDNPGTFQSGQNFSSILSSLLTQSNPTSVGLIGSANCSIGQLLCVCGGNAPISEPDCYVGVNDGHIYLIEYCNSSLCQVSEHVSI